MDLSEYLTTTQVAKFLGVTRQEVTRKIWCGTLKAEKVGDIYLILKSEVKRIKSD